jgi:hypothetical protein
MIEVDASLSVADACSGATVVLDAVESDEADDAPGLGDGSTTNDIHGATAGSTDSSFALRAERLASGNGRIYTVRYSATDGAGNRAWAACTCLAIGAEPPACPPALMVGGCS